MKIGQICIHSGYMHWNTRGKHNWGREMEKSNDILLHCQSNKIIANILLSFVLY